MVAHRLAATYVLGNGIGANHFIMAASKVQPIYVLQGMSNHSFEKQAANGRNVERLGDRAIRSKQLK